MFSQEETQSLLAEKGIGKTVLQRLQQMGLDDVAKLAAAVNCTLWVAYGLFLKPRNWPIIVANVPGVVLGIVAFFTSL